MIKIYRTDTAITIKGHAGYGPYGQDIVCAGVSALTYTLISSIEVLTKDRIEYTIRSGDLFLTHGTLSNKANLLIESFFIGLENLEKAYPGHIEIAQA